MMEYGERQKRLDDLGLILGELFAEGLDQAPDNVKRMVLDGLAAKRVFVSVQIVMPPLAISFGVVDLQGENRVSLFQLIDPSEKKFVVEQLGPESDTVN